MSHLSTEIMVLVDGIMPWTVDSYSFTLSILFLVILCDSRKISINIHDVDIKSNIAMVYIRVWHGHIYTLELKLYIYILYIIMAGP